MAGLLDGGYSPDPLAMGLLGMGGALLTPRQLGGGIGPAMQQFSQQAMQAQMLKRQMAQDQQRSRLTDATIKKYEQDAEMEAVKAQQVKAELARQERIRQRLGQDGGMPAPIGAIPAAALNVEMPTSLGFGGGFLGPAAGPQATSAPSFGMGDPAPAPTGGKPSRLAAHNQYMKFATIYESEGDFEKGMKYREMAQKALPEVQGRDVVLVNGKPTVRIFFKDGTYEDVNDAAPKADTRTEDFGGYKQNRDNYTGSLIGPQIPVTMTQAQIKADQVARGNLGVAQGNLALSRQRFTADQEAGKRPQTITTNEGVFVVTPGQGGGMPTFTPATGLDGKPLVKLKDPTEGERSAAGYVSRMQAAEKNLADLAAQGKKGEPTLFREMAANLPGTGGKWGPYVRTEDQQLYRQAQEEWVRAKLRKESGASIPTDEMDREIMTYFPQPGESQAIIDQKAQSRQQAMAGLRVSAGRAEIPGYQQGPGKADPLGIR